MTENINEEYAKALESLRAGGIILYPTDTVWGLGCDATNPEAVAKIYGIKKRSDSKSLVLLASDMDMICRYVKEVPEMAIQLVEVNDKPMTIIYPGAIAGPVPAEGTVPGEEGWPHPNRYNLAFNTVAEDGSVGIRIPMMDFCRNLVAKFGRPIVSTSANISGEATPARYAEISQQIKDAADHIAEPSLEAYSSGKASSIIKVGLDYQIEIIRK